MLKSLCHHNISTALSGSDSVNHQRSYSPEMNNEGLLLLTALLLIIVLDDNLLRSLETKYVIYMCTL